MWILLKKLLGAGEFPIPTSLNPPMSRTHICSLTAQYFESKQTSPSTKKGLLSRPWFWLKWAFAPPHTSFGTGREPSPGSIPRPDRPPQPALQWHSMATRWREGTELGHRRRFLSPCRERSTFVSLLFLPAPLFDFTIFCVAFSPL